MQVVIDWILAHQVVLAGALVGLLDLLLAINPKLDANGIFHWVYLKLKDLSAKK
jgi:hypothetical protein